MEPKKWYENTERMSAILAYAVLLSMTAVVIAAAIWAVRAIL